MPACCGMLTMGFHLFFCKIEVIEPPSPGPGVLYPGRIGKRARDEDDEIRKKRIRITVKFKDSKRWIREYEVDEKRAKVTIKAINIINSISKRLNVGVDHVRNAARRVSAVFTRSDK